MSKKKKQPEEPNIELIAVVDEVPAVVLIDESLMSPLSRE